MCFLENMTAMLHQIELGVPFGQEEKNKNPPEANILSICPLDTLSG
jgi:hypothetical protein